MKGDPASSATVDPSKDLYNRTETELQQRLPAFGLDFIECGVPLADHPPPGDYGPVRVGGGTAYLRVYYRGNQAYASWSGNPTTIFGLGCGPAPTECFVPFLELIGTESAKLFPVAGGLLDTALRRLDVTADIFEVRDIAPYAFASLALPVPYAKDKTLHAQGRSGTPQTTTVGKQGAKRMLYDKAAQSPDTTVPGQVRFEVRADRAWLRNAPTPIRTVEDVTDSAIQALGWKHWHASFGTLRITGRGALLRAVANLHDRDGRPWSRRRQDGLLGHLMRVSMGEFPEISKARRADYRRAMAQVGIHLHPAVFDITLASDEVRWLDLAEQREVVANG